MCPAPKTLDEAAKAVREKMAREGQNTQLRTFEQRLANAEKTKQETENKQAEMEQMVIQLKVEMDEAIERLGASIARLEGDLDRLVTGLAALVGPKVTVVDRGEPEPSGEPGEGGQ